MGEGGSDPPSLPVTLVDSLPSVSTFRLLEDLPRCNNDLANADLERLWLQVNASLAMMFRSGELKGDIDVEGGRMLKGDSPVWPPFRHA